MNTAEFLRTTSRHAKLIAKIGDVIEQNGLTPAEGEAVLLHLAGLSAGDRQQSIRCDDWLNPLTVSWGFAAERGGDVEDELEAMK